MTMSRQPALFDNFLTSYLRDLERWMREWGISINVSKRTAILFAKACRRFPIPRPVRLFGEQIHWVEPPLFLGVTIDTRLTWTTHVDQVRKEAAQRMVVLALLLNSSSGLSIITGVVLYNQLIRPVMDYTCLIWTSAARTHVRKLQVLQSRCLRFATSAAWHTGNRKIYEDLGVPFFANHIRSHTERFDSK
jgi:hypothetical protein